MRTKSHAVFSNAKGVVQMQFVLKVYPLVSYWYVSDKLGFAMMRMFKKKHDAILFARSFAHDQDIEIIIRDKKWNVECIESYVKKPIEQQVAE